MLMKFRLLAESFNKIEKTASRLEKEVHVNELFSNLDSEECAIISYFLTERLCPMFIQKEFALSGRGISKVLSLMFSEEQVNKNYVSQGDLGNVFEILAGNVRGQALEIKEIYRMLWQIVKMSGSGSVEQKHAMTKQILQKCSGLEGKYLIRLILSKLRLGCNDRTILSALSKRLNVESDILDYAYGVCSDIGYISQVAIKDGVDGVLNITPELGIPIGVQLVERAKDFESVMKRYPKVLVQPKFDGVRCQIHIWNGEYSNSNYRVWSEYIKEHEESGLFNNSKTSEDKKVKMFSRNLEDLSGMFPELVQDLILSSVNNCILDSEIVGIGSDGNPIPFQETVKRRRKHDVAQFSLQIPVKAFVFDLMYRKNSTNLTTGTKDRIKHVKKIVSKLTDKFVFAETNEITTVKELEQLFEKYTSAGWEGVIVKNPTSSYQPGLRNFEWIKIKRSINEHMVDTVDVVVLGYYMGTGKRASRGVGAILAGVYDPDSDKYVTVSKIGTGITDEQLSQIKARLDEIAVDKCPGNVSVKGILKPDIFVNPEIVCVIEADDVTRSTNHTSGYSLRFPRLIEFERRDKSAQQATTLKEIVSLA